MVFAIVSGVAFLIMGLIVSLYNLEAIQYNSVDEFVYTLIVVWIILSIAIGAALLFLGLHNLAIGTPVKGLPIKNRAYRILAIYQFGRKGKIHFLVLVVPLNDEGAMPLYLFFDHGKIPNGIKIGHVIMNVNKRLRILTLTELPVQEQDAP